MWDSVLQQSIRHVFVIFPPPFEHHQKQQQPSPLAFYPRLCQFLMKIMLVINRVRHLGLCTTASVTGGWEQPTWDFARHLQSPLGTVHSGLCTTASVTDGWERLTWDFARRLQSLAGTVHSGLCTTASVTGGREQPTWDVYDAVTGINNL